MKNRGAIAVVESVLLSLAATLSSCAFSRLKEDVKTWESQWAVDVSLEMREKIKGDIVAEEDWGKKSCGGGSKPLRGMRRRRATAPAMTRGRTPARRTRKMCTPV